MTAPVILYFVEESWRHDQARLDDKFKVTQILRLAGCHEYQMAAVFYQGTNPDTCMMDSYFNSYAADTYREYAEAMTAFTMDEPCFVTFTTRWSERTSSINQHAKEILLAWCIHELRKLNDTQWSPEIMFPPLSKLTYMINSLRHVATSLDSDANEILHHTQNAYIEKKKPRALFQNEV